MNHSNQQKKQFPLGIVLLALFCLAVSFAAFLLFDFSYTKEALNVSSVIRSAAFRGIFHV